MASCNTCYENINKKNKEIICVHCQFKACINCCKKYILGSVNNAKCMNCSKNWGRDFLIDHFSYSFVNKTYKKHREQVIFQEQLSMMVETQSIIEKRKQIDEINKLLYEKKNKINEIRYEIGLLTNKKLKIQNKHTKEIEKFYGHCPENNCRGFINSSWECGICKIKICKSCKEKISDSKEERINHECNPDILESISKIKKDSKPCPKCKSMIYRIEGCSQMHCTNCRTNYNWTSGEIITSGFFHNPHYTEWRKTHETDGATHYANNNCGDNLFQNIQIYRFDKRLVCDVYKKRFIIEFIRFLYHVYDMELYEFRNPAPDTYLELRVYYMQGYISEQIFKTKLQQHEKKKNKKNDIFLIFDMLYNAGRDIILRLNFDNDLKERISVPQDNVIKAMNEMIELINYTNDSMKKIHTIYKNKVPIIRLPKFLDANDTISFV